MAGSLVDLQTLGSLSVEGEDKSVVDIGEVNCHGLRGGVVLTVAKVVKAQVGKVERGGRGFGLIATWACKIQCNVRWRTSHLEFNFIAAISLVRSKPRGNCISILLSGSKAIVVVSYSDVFGLSAGSKRKLRYLISRKRLEHEPVFPSGERRNCSVHIESSSLAVTKPCI